MFWSVALAIVGFLPVTDAFHFSCTFDGISHFIYIHTRIFFVQIKIKVRFWTNPFSIVFNQAHFDVSNFKKDINKETQK